MAVNCRVFLSLPRLIATCFGIHISRCLSSCLEWPEMDAGSLHKYQFDIAIDVKVATETHERENFCRTR